VTWINISDGVTDFHTTLFCKGFFNIIVARPAHFYKGNILHFDTQFIQMWLSRNSSAYHLLITDSASPRDDLWLVYKSYSLSLPVCSLVL
jgi:hypothetical protein